MTRPRKPGSRRARMLRRLASGRTVLVCGNANIGIDQHGWSIKFYWHGGTTTSTHYGDICVRKKRWAAARAMARHMHNVGPVREVGREVYERERSGT